jgi:hypothetical protein
MKERETRVKQSDSKRALQNSHRFTPEFNKLDNNAEAPRQGPQCSQQTIEATLKNKALPRDN